MLKTKEQIEAENFEQKFISKIGELNQDWNNLSKEAKNLFYQKYRPIMIELEKQDLFLNSIVKK